MTAVKIVTQTKYIISGFIVVPPSRLSPEVGEIAAYRSIGIEDRHLRSGARHGKAAFLTASGVLPRRAVASLGDPPGSRVAGRAGGHRRRAVGGKLHGRRGAARRGSNQGLADPGSCVSVAGTG